MPPIKQQLWRFAAAAFTGTLAVSCAGALLFTSGYLISRSSLQPENVLMVYVPIVLVRAFGFGKAAIQYAERLISHDTVLRILSRMRIRLYRILELQALHLRSRFRTGDLLGLLAEDIEKLQHVYLRLVLPAVTAVLLYAAGIAALGRMDGTFALLMALYCGFLLFALPVFALFVSRKWRKRYMMERSMAYQELTDAVFGMSDWLLSGRSGQFLADFHERQKSMAEAEKRMRRAEWRLQWLSQCAVSGAVILLALWAGRRSLNGAMEAEWIAAFALVAFPLLDALVRAGEAVIRTPDYRGSLERLEQVEAAGIRHIRQIRPSAPPETAGAPTANASTADAPADKTIHPLENVPDLLLDRVSFRYPGSEEWSLRDVTLRVPKGSAVAVIGRSGAGKTTLLHLIQGELVPVSGTVTLNGVPVREAAGEASRLFAVLNQQPYLFDTTISNNIRLGRPGAADEEVREAAERAGLGRLISSLPDGLETRVREAGDRFSGGERQRIALARILLQNCPIVLLDEPTVGLDPVTERELMDTIFETLQGRTLIWITHHLSGMERMDQIVFMDRGRIAMQGTHEQLLKNSERYRQLYALDRPRLH
ncbi:cysteine export CydDC family ABC transporter permease subunit/ATP-binding protein CydC [Thermobacillus composti KWC4]|uniref:Cysteine export CydDC family ABC transporter permease subunit/ATP-binding protein CydC n=1 Tax=Thermobacillus composti (strain DSM 18247 / JCM 13945 / KWC4) TaxID=717605 RepID=L0EBM6_THECK|nr:thiol reductant ABC exporter subunit CydC [Thermobacillus composti]AGA57086.1 cysteine export CydDC family ABC transporter permease subunit/ATP-binding protein CydC [Thermobacillus composti KWC4]